MRTGRNRPRLYISLRIFTILPPNKGHFYIVYSQQGGILRLSTSPTIRSGETIGPGRQRVVFQTTGRQESSSEGPLELSDEPAPRRCSRRVQGLWKPCCYISGRVLDFPAALVTRTEGGLHVGYPSQAGVCRRTAGLGGHGLDHRYRSSLSPRRRRRRGRRGEAFLLGSLAVRPAHRSPDATTTDDASNGNTVL